VHAPRARSLSMHEPEPEPERSIEPRSRQHDAFVSMQGQLDLAATSNRSGASVPPATGAVPTTAVHADARTPHGLLQLPDGALPLKLRDHAAYLMAVVKKGVPQAYDSNRLTMLHFAVAGLDLLGQRELLDPYRYELPSVVCALVLHDQPQYGYIHSASKWCALLCACSDGIVEWVYQLQTVPPGPNHSSQHIAGFRGGPFAYFGEGVTASVNGSEGTSPRQYLVCFGTLEICQ
jgi:hypothetical protein